MRRAAVAAAAAAALLVFLREIPEPRHSVELPPPAPERPAAAASGRKLITRRPEATKPSVQHAPENAEPRPDVAVKPAAKENTLDDILRSGNDNDPRLDSDFNDLSAVTKDAFRLKYRRLPPENLNERGTIVYLLGKNLAEPEDWAFLRELVVEAPCLSLADCAKQDASAGEHGNPGSAVTLSYPALVALKQAQWVLENARRDDSSRREALEVVRAAKNSRSPIVMKAALEVEP